MAKKKNFIDRIKDGDVKIEIAPERKSQLTYTVDPNLQNNNRQNDTFLNKLVWTGKNFISGAQGGVLNTISAPFQSMATGFNRGAKQSEQEQNIFDKLKNTGKNAIKNIAYRDVAGRLIYDATLGREDTFNRIMQQAQQLQNNYNQVQENARNTNENPLWTKVKQAGMVIGGATSSVTQDFNPVVQELYNAGQYTGQILGKDKAEQERDKLLKIDENINKNNDEWQEQLAKQGEFYGKGWQTVGGASQSVGNMTPSILLGMVTGGAGASQGVSQALSMAQLGLSAKGQETRKSLKQGADLETAERRGVASGTAEVGSEFMFEGLKPFKTFRENGIEDVAKKYIADSLEKKLKSDVGKKLVGKLANAGIDIAGETVEEWTTDIYNTWLDRATIDPNAEYTLEQAMETALSTALSTGAINTGYSAINTGLDKIYKRNQDNVNNKVEITPEVRQESNDYKTTLQGMVNNLDIPQQIKDEIQPMLDSNAVVTKEDFDGLKESIKDIVKNNGEVQKTQLLEQAYNTTAIDNQIESLNQLTPEKFNNQESRQFYAKQMNKPLTYNVDTILDAYPENRNGKRTVRQWKDMSKQIGTQMAIDGLSIDEVRANAVGLWQQLEPSKNITRYDNQEHKNKGFDKLNNEIWTKGIYDSYKETMRTQLEQQQEQATSEEVLNPQLEAIDDNTNILLDTIDSFNANEQVSEQVKESLLESAERYGFKGKTLNEIQKAMEKRGISSRFDDTKFNDSRVGSFYDPNNNEIVFNPNASEEQIIQELAVHEWYHELKQNNTEEATKIQEDIINYLKRNNQYADIRKNLEKTYIEQGYDKNRPDFTDMIDEEATAKALQQVLGNEEEIQRLNNYNRNLARRIYDAVVNLLNKFTGGRNEKLFWTNVRNNFERVFNTPGTAKENNQSDNQKRLSTNTESSEQGSINLQKEQQLEIIKNSNPMQDDYHTGIRTINDIQTYQEALDDEIVTTPDYTEDDMKKALDKGKVTVYSSYPIEQGVFVTPSKMEAQNYAGNNQVYSKEVNLNDVAWIDSLQGQYAKVNNIQSNKDNLGRTLTKEQQEYFKDSKVRDENGNLITVYHGTPIKERFNIFDRSKAGANTKADFDGIYFTDSKDFGERFAHEQIPVGDSIASPVRLGERGNLYEGYLNIKNPLNLNNLSKEQIEELYNYVKDEWKELSPKEDFIRRWQKMNNKVNAQGIKFDLDFSKVEQAGYDGIIANLGEREKINGEYQTKDENEYIVFNSNQIKNVDNTNPTQNADIRYSVSTSNETDNNGDNLSNGQVNYFKDSKAKVDNNTQVDTENGKLATVYHTTTDRTAQFNEFNPVGTREYRFGDQVVNYFTDNKDMSGSYADNKYRTADTRKLKSIDEVKEYLDNLNNNTEEIKYAREKANGNKYIIKNISGINYVIESSDVDSEALNFLNSLSENELEQLNDNIFHDEDFVGTPYEYAFAWDKFDKSLLDKYKKVTDKYVGDDTLVDIQKRMVEYLRNPTKYDENKTYNGTLVGAYETEDELFRNLKQDIQKADWTNNSKIQYEGYVNITNPYIIDANDENWDTVSSRLSNNGEELIDILETIKNNKALNDIKTTLKDVEKNSYNIANEYAKTTSKMSFMANQLSDAIARTGSLESAKKQLKDLGWSQAEIENALKEKINNKSIIDIGLEYYNNKYDDLFSRAVENLKQRYRFLDNINDGQLDALLDQNFDEKLIRERYSENNTTNDIVNQVIEMNKNGANYDGVIIKNVIDYGGQSQTREPANVYVTFNSNQFKAKDNLNPTLDKDLRYSKNTQDYDSWIKENLPKLGNKKTKLSDLKVPTKKQANVPTKQVKLSENTVETTPTETETYEKVPIKNNQKQRKAYKSIIESEFTSKEAKQIAYDYLNNDTYVPDSNKEQLDRADKRIERNGIENELASLETNVNEGKKITAEDIAVGDRLIKYYMTTGDKANLERSIRAMAMAGTQAGRTVQAFAMIRHQSPEGMAIWIQNSVDKLNSNRQGKTQFEFTPEMQEKILNSNSENLQQNVDEVMKELGQQVPVDFLGKLDAWRYFSMLGNPKTHIRNIVGNFAMAQTQKVKSKIAGTIEQVTGQDRTHTSLFERRNRANIDFAKQDLKNDVVKSGLGIGTSKYTSPKSQIEQNQRTFKSDKLENTLGRLFKLNDNLLEAEDNFGLKNAYVRNLSDYMTANKLTADTITNEQLQQARKIAIEESLRATFHQASALATAINQIEQKNLFNRVLVGGLIPFKKTPINVAKSGFEYSPVGLAKAMVVDTVNLKKGKINVNEYIDNISKGLTGTAIATVGYALAEAGILKAGGDDDKEDKYKENMGDQPYSITINGKSYSLDWLAPSGIPLFVGAELNKLVHDTTEKDGETENDVYKALGRVADASTSLLNPMSEMSMISGLTSTIQSFSQDPGQALMNLVVSPVKSFAGQTVPTALGQVARSTDEYERDTSSTETGLLPKAVDQTKNQIMNKIPGLRQMLPTKKDVWGEEIKTQNYFYNAVLPSTVKDIKNNPVDKELNNLYEKTGENIYPTTSLDKTFTINGTQKRLTNEEYNKYKESYGKNSYRILNNLVNSNDYKKMTDEQKVKAIQDVYTYTKDLNKVDYAEKKGLTLETPSDVATVKSIKSYGGSETDYFKYKGLTKGLDKEKDKMEKIRNSDMSLTSKQAVYKSTIGKDDEFYNTIDSTNINEYLDYKHTEFESDKDKNGKTVKNSLKNKKADYINSNISGYENRLLLMAKDYKLSRAEQQTLLNYINTQSNAEEIFNKLDKNFEVKNGRVYYK